jgi:uncharacterized protein (DUF305 family)
MKEFRSAGSRILLALFVLGACRGSQPEVRPAPEASAVHPDSAAIARAQADSARLPYTEADVHFMSAMISHHAQAIHMAEMAPTHAASAEVQRLAERIINAQQDEIATMQRWLRERRQPVPEPSILGHRMTMNGQEHVMLMPGMLTAEQLKALDQARGADFDWLFITSMIQHHRGAVEMVKQLFGTYGAGQDETVFKFASDVNVDQTTEINRMIKLLASLPGQGRSP